MPILMETKKYELEIRKRELEEVISSVEWDSAERIKAQKELDEIRLKLARLGE